MRTGSLRASIAIFVFVAAMGLTSQPTSAAAPTLLGAEATYDVIGTSAGMGHAGGMASGTSSTSLTVTTRSQRIHSRVIGLNANSMKIHSVIQDSTSGVQRTANFEVALSQGLPILPGTLTASGSGIAFNDSSLIPLRQGGTATIQRTGYAQDGWIENVTVSTAQLTLPTANLSVKLLRHSRQSLGLSGAGAVWLAPTLMSPSDVRVVSGSALPAKSSQLQTTADPRTTASRQSRSGIGQAPSAAANSATSPAPGCNVTANSTLNTYDNHTVGLEVWYSTAMLCGHLVNGAYYDAYQEGVTPVATSPNWWVTNVSCNFTSSSNYTATSVGQGDFEGVFPFGILILWQGHASHQLTLNLTNHQVWLTGEIDVYRFSLPGPFWEQFKKQQFYNGNTYPNDGSSQDASWYILDSF